jgi:hypothetical protein
MRELYNLRAKLSVRYLTNYVENIEFKKRPLRERRMDRGGLTPAGLAQLAINPQLGAEVALPRHRREPAHESVTVPKLNVAAVSELFGRLNGGGIIRVIVQEFDSSGIERPVWAEAWHIWKVIIPRRSITGRLVYGKVWRRCDRRHWIYKKFVEYDE